MGRISPCAQHHEAIVALASQGIPRFEIANRIGVTKVAVQAYLQRRRILVEDRGFSRRVLDPETLRQALEVEGLTQSQAAERFQCSLSCIERSASRLGLKTARTGPRAGVGHPEWRGGRYLDKHGYVMVYAPLHPHCRKQGYLAEHRLVLEVALGRYLLPSEVVDHIDGHPRHNWPSNLREYSSNAAHLRSTLSGLPKASPRSSIPGAYGSSQKLDRCPGPDETLAQCPSELRSAIEQHILAHRLGREEVTVSQSAVLRSGARLPVFQ